jgi:hypothetical protein
VTAPVTAAAEGRQRKRQKLLMSEAILAVRQGAGSRSCVSCTLWTDVHCTAVPLRMWMCTCSAVLQAGRAVKPVGTQLSQPSKAAQGAKQKAKGRQQQQPRKQQAQAGTEAATLDIWGAQTQQSSAGALHMWFDAIEVPRDCMHTAQQD